MKSKLYLILFVTFSKYLTVFAITREEIVDIYKDAFSMVVTTYKDIINFKTEPLRAEGLTINSKLINTIEMVLPKRIIDFIKAQELDDLIILLLSFCPGQPYQVSEENFDLFNQSIQCLSFMFYYSPEQTTEPFFINLNFLKATRELFIFQQHLQDYTADKGSLSMSIERLLCEKSKKSIACAIARLMQHIHQLFSYHSRDSLFISQTGFLTKIIRENLQKIYKTKEDLEILKGIQKTLTVVEIFPKEEAESMLTVLFRLNPA